MSDDQQFEGFERTVPFDPAGEFDPFLKSVPAKWVVYLLHDIDRRPVQLLCVKNLRYSLKRRLGGDEQVGPTRRVNYRDLVRHISWRRVDSDFEADWVYYEAARHIFPDTYRGMVGFRSAWFIHVNPDANFPRYIKTNDLTIRTGMLIGPVEDKHSAADLIQRVEDWFDLCRYYSILVQAPRGHACAYKEMGKCPAPCDGSISMPQYRRLVEWSARVIVDPAEYLREQTRRMQQAAAELRFEVAGKIKAYVEDLSKLGKGSLRHVAKLSEFSFVSIQRGPRRGTAKVFLVTPGKIEHLACVLDEKFKPAEIMRLALTLAHEPPPQINQPGVERVGIVTHHLFSPKAAASLFLPLAKLDEKGIAKAYKDLQKLPEAVEVEEEGVTRELAAQ